MASQRPTNSRNALPTPTSTSAPSCCSSSTGTGLPTSAPSALPLLPSVPRLRRETRSVTGSSVRAASGQESTEEGAGAGSPSGVATGGGLPLTPLGEGEGEGEETGSVGVTTAERSQSPPLYPQDEVGIPAAAAAAQVREEDEDLDADEPPDYFLAGADAETLFRRGVHHLQLAQGNINELDRVNGLAGGLPAAVEARRNVTVAETELRQALTMIHREFGREDERKAELTAQLTELNAQLRRDLQQLWVRLDRERGRANAANQLRNRLELLLHQAHLQNQRQQVELLEAVPEIQQLIMDRDNAAADAHDLEQGAIFLRLQNVQLEEQLGAITAEHARNLREARQIHAELHRWHRRAVRLNNERAPGNRYELPHIAHRDDVDDPALHFEPGDEFDDVYDSDAETIFGGSL